jgi:hypothetical protein
MGCLRPFAFALLVFAALVSLLPTIKTLLISTSGRRGPRIYSEPLDWTQRVIRRAPTKRPSVEGRSPIDNQKPADAWRAALPKLRAAWELDPEPDSWLSTAGTGETVIVESSSPSPAIVKDAHPSVQVVPATLRSKDAPPATTISGVVNEDKITRQRKSLSRRIIALQSAVRSAVAGKTDTEAPDPFAELAGGRAGHLETHRRNDQCWKHFDFGMLEEWDARKAVFCAAPPLSLSAKDSSEEVSSSLTCRVQVRCCVFTLALAIAPTPPACKHVLLIM